MYGKWGYGDLLRQGQGQGAQGDADLIAASDDVDEARQFTGEHDTCT